MIKNKIKKYLDNTPARYDNADFLRFIEDVGMPPLPPAIHITGTNGKGSSANYLAATLVKSGYRVGLFTSPYLFNVNEMITINGREISDEYILSQIEKYDKDFKKYRVSSFEIMTFIAFSYFSAQKVDYAVVEVGMGGLNDSTNIITPILSIITNIGVDHTAELGPTLIDIAYHKAGIIKDKIPLLIGDMAGAAKDVIVAKAREKSAKVYSFINDFEVNYKSLTKIEFTYEDKNYTLASGALYEVRNAILVINAIKILEQLGVNILENAVQEALRISTLPGRFSVVSTNPAVIIDGAHNFHAFVALLNDLKATNKNITAIFAAFKDKDYEQELDLLALSGANIILTTFDHPRAIKTFNSSLPFFAHYREAIKQTLPTLKAEDLLLIVGSLHFAMQVTLEFWGGMYASHT